MHLEYKKNGLFISTSIYLFPRIRKKKTKDHEINFLVSFLNKITKKNHMLNLYYKFLWFSVKLFFRNSKTLFP